MPFFAPTPLPTMIATGVASPRAHGQLMTSTDIPRARAKPAGRPSSSHTAAVTTAIAMTAGTNTPDTLSAMRAIGAFVAEASDTIRMICESVVSSPTRTASQVRQPERLTVAADTASPAALSTGTLSPVSAASSTAASPDTTTPSTGMLSPGRTMKTSPTRTSATGTTVSAPSRSTVAVRGASRMSDLSASVVLPFARASSSLPTVMSVRIMPADSKYSSPAPPFTRTSSTYTLQRNAAVAPIATRVSMFGARCASPRKPLTKNFRLTTMMIPARSICMTPPPAGPVRSGGSGQPSIPWPIETYISAARKTSEAISRFLRSAASASAGDASNASASAAEETDDDDAAAPFFRAP